MKRRKIMRLTPIYDLTGYYPVRRINGLFSVPHDQCVYETRLYGYRLRNDAVS